MASEAAKVAANWWGNAVCGNARHDTGAGMINLYGVLAEGRKPAASGTARDQFVAALEASIDARVAKSGEVWLRVDYHPEGLLVEVCRGLAPEFVRTFSFPPKTSMSISANDVTVNNGYRARTQRLYGEPQWRVVLYTVSYQDRFDPYYGPDEAQARAVYAMAKVESAAFPGSKAILYCDGNDMGGDDR